MRRIIFTLSFLISSFIYAQAEKSILVLDASGSMWGKLDNTAKIEIARDVVSNLVKTWPQERELGLVAYGHREKGDCNDIEVIIEPGKLDASAFDQKVRALVPKGKTPMVAAIKKAAESLKFSEDPATVILVSDGEETCNEDPCSVAKELESQGIKFTAHVIGFDLKNAGGKAETQMKCIAEATGGNFLTANNASELNAALKQAVVVQEVKATPTPEAKGTHNLKASALEITGSSLIKDGLTWVLSRVSATGEKGEYIETSYDSEYKASLAPGKYFLETKWGDALKSQILEIGDKAQDLKVVMNAGTIKLKALANETEQIKEGIFWLIKDDKGQEVSSSYDPEPIFKLLEGKYKGEIKWGEANSGFDFDILPAKNSSQSVVIGAGLIQPKAFAVEGGEQVKESLFWTVQKLVSSLENKYEDVSSSYDAEPKIKLAAGSYLLKVKWGEAKAEQEVTVVSGKSTDLKIVLNAGVVKVTAVSADGSAVASPSWRVYTKSVSISGTRESLTYSYDVSPQFLLTAGEYTIEVEVNGVVSSIDVKVDAGKRVESQVKLK